MEVMPNAIQLMATAAKDAGLSVNGTVAEMLDLQKNGKLISSKVLPEFAEALSNAARNNNGLDDALKSNRVSMNRLQFTMEEAADNFFKSGFSEGLTDLFNSMSSFIRNNTKLWKSLGTVVGGVLKLLAKLVTVLEKAFQALGAVIDGVVFIMGDFAALLALPFALAFVKKMGMMTASVLTFGRATAAANAMASGGTIGAAAGSAGKAGLSRALAMSGAAGLGVGAVGALGSFLQPKDIVSTPQGPQAPGSFIKNLEARMAAQTGVLPNQAQPIKVTVDVDGETLAETMVNTQTMENHTDSRIQHNLGG